MSEVDVRDQLADYFGWIDAGSEFPLSSQLVEEENPEDKRRGWLRPALLAAMILVAVGTVWTIVGGRGDTGRLRTADIEDIDVSPEATQREAVDVRKVLAPFGVPSSSRFSLASFELLPTEEVDRSVSIHQIKFLVDGTSDSSGDLLISVIESEAELQIEGELNGPRIGPWTSQTSESAGRSSVSWLMGENTLVELVSRTIPLEELIDLAMQQAIADGEVEAPEGITPLLTGIGRTYPDGRDGTHVFSSSRNLNGYESILRSNDSVDIAAAMFRGDPLAELVTYATLYPSTQVELQRVPAASEPAIIASDVVRGTKYLVWEEAPNLVFSDSSAPDGLVGILEADISVDDDVLIQLVEQMVPAALPASTDLSGVPEEGRAIVEDLELSGNLVVGVRTATTGADVLYATVDLQSACVRVLGIELQPDQCVLVERVRPGSATFVRLIGDDVDGGERSILVVGASNDAIFEGVPFSDPPWTRTRRGITFHLLSTYQEDPIVLQASEPDGTIYPPQQVVE